MKKFSCSRRLYIVTFAILTLFVLGLVFSMIGYQTYNASYHQDMSLAQEGIQHLRTSTTLLATFPQHPLDARSVSQAGQEFAAALTSFTQLDHNLKSLPGISTSIPIYGTRLSSALRLLPLAIEIAQTGATSCTILNLIISRLQNPGNIQGQGLATTDFITIEQNFRQIRTGLNLISNQINHLQPADLQLDPRLVKMVASFHKNLPTLQSWLDTVENLFPVFPTLLGIGTPTNYLVELLDSTELRPGGGFIGNYGIATISGGRLVSAHITDTYLLDKPFVANNHSIPFPAAYTWFDLSPEGWSLRDSNLDADFPTAARYAEQLYRQEGGNVPVQGVIAITPALIQQALAITGPISVPEYQETVTAENLIARIHYHQLGSTGDRGGTTPSSDGYSSDRKHFTALLAEHFLARVHQLPSSAAAKFLQLLISGLHSKDLQVYLNPGIAENLLQRFHLDATIQATNSDSLMIVDANISPNKANSLITNTLNDKVIIDAEGNVTHHTTINYAWAIAGQLYGSSIYRDYIRVYAPPNSILQEQEGWQPEGTATAFGHEVWAGFFTLSLGQSLTISLTWTIPRMAQKVTQGHNNWHYQYLIQRQAGVLWKLQLQVMLPPCATVVNKSQGIISKSQSVETLAQSLRQDTNVTLDYAC